MDIERAKAVCQVAEQIIESAKVEVKFMEVNASAAPSKFFDKRLANVPQLAGKPNGSHVA
jgi:hypothetical protein